MADVATFERSATTLQDMIVIPGGTFRMGSDNHYPEEAPAHRVTVDAFLDGPHTGDEQPAVRRIRQRNRPRGRLPAETPPDPKDYPGALPHMIWRGSLLVLGTGASAGRSARLEPMVDLPRVARTGATPMARSSNIDGLDDHPVVHVAFADALMLMPDGPAKTCRPRPSGSLRRAVVSMEPNLPGAMSSCPAEPTWRTPGRANFRARISLLDGFERTSPVTAFPGKRLRPARHDRQCVGVDDRLVFPQARSRCTRRHAAFRKTRAAEPEAASYDPCLPNIRILRKVLGERRLAPLRPELLPPLPSGRAPCRADRHLD